MAILCWASKNSLRGTLAELEKLAARLLFKLRGISNW
jgi:hypothetical protein